MKTQWKASLNGVWFNVLGIRDTGISADNSLGGNVYTLECVSTGIQIDVHQSMIEALDEIDD